MKNGYLKLRRFKVYVHSFKMVESSKIISGVLSTLFKKLNCDFQSQIIILRNA
jgi:hypothetical protein